MIFSFFTKLSFELAEQSSSENLRIIEQAAGAHCNKYFFSNDMNINTLFVRVKSAPLTPGNLTLTIVTSSFVKTDFDMIHFIQALPL